MAKKRTSKTAHSSVPDLTRADEVYRKVRNRILNGEFAPGVPLSEYQLASQFELSRTPVREALARLEHEGMVRTVPGIGTLVSEITPHDIMEIYQVREKLESYAARVAAERMDVVGLNRLQHIIQQMRECAAAGYANETFASDIDLHKTIIRATQNERMFAILATLDDQMHRIRLRWVRTPRWMDGTLAEHEQIVQSIIAHDQAGADEAMRKHLRASCDHSIRFLMPMLDD